MKNAARPFYKSARRAQKRGPAFALRPIACCVMLAGRDPSFSRFISSGLQPTRRFPVFFPAQ